MKKLASLLLLLLLFSCATTDDVELFFMGDDSLQYFFPSRQWVSEDKNLRMEADWLYRNFALDGEPQARTILNFTLISPVTTYKDLPKEIIIFSSNYKVVIPSDQISIIYVDRGRTRYSCWVPSSKVNTLFSGADKEGLAMNLTLEKEYRLKSSPSFQEHIAYFQDVLGIDEGDDHSP